MPDIFEYGDEDLDEPMSDAQVAERLKRSIPYWNDVSTDAFLAADPRIRTILADAYVEGEGDPVQSYAALNDIQYQKQLVDALGGGRGTYDRLGDMGKEGYRRALRMRGNSMLENAFAASVPSAQRNLGLVDMLSERYGGRPYPGAGAGIPGYAGPGFGGGMGGMEGGMGGGGMGGGDPMMGGGGGLGFAKGMDGPDPRQLMADLETVRDFEERYGVDPRRYFREGRQRSFDGAAGGGFVKGKKQNRSRFRARKGRLGDGIG